MSVNEKMTAIADAIREYGQLDDIRLTLDDMAKSIPNLYEHAYQEGEMAGQSMGEKQGYAAGLVAGQKKERNAFWDVLQAKGNEQSYYYAFAYNRFTDENYNPVRNIVCAPGKTTGRYIFYEADYITDTKVSVEANDDNAQYAFANSGLVTIRLFRVYASTNLTATFANCDKLVNLTMDGVIGKDIDLHWSPLSLESIESVFDHLLETVSGTATFNEQAVLNAFGTEEAWLAYIAAKDTWEFSLI